MAEHVGPLDRAVLEVSGADARPFLQALVTNDVGRVGEGRAVYAALLTPQGKYLFDFFVAAHGEALWIDCEAACREALRKRLSTYRLRARVAIEDRPEEEVHAVIGADAAEALARVRGGVRFADPRLDALGARAILGPGGGAALEAAGIARADRAAYDALRIGLGAPDGRRDMTEAKSLPLENGFEALNGVDFDKGCYVGQEVTARMKHRGLIRRRLVPVRFDGPAPAPGTPVHDGGAAVGEVRSAEGQTGLAMLRLEVVAAARELRAGEVAVAVEKPFWADY